MKLPRDFEEAGIEPAMISYCSGGTLWGSMWAAGLSAQEMAEFSLSWDIDGVLANNDEMALGAIQAMKAAGIDMASVIVSGVDATQDALASMQAGELDITVFQNAAAQGGGALDAAVKLSKGEAVEKKVYIPFELVTPANVADYAAKN